jgi:N-acetylglucosamine-6-phosphate deacetylase
MSGWVDLQVNGYAGVDFSGPSLAEEDAARAFRQVIEGGADTFLPTLITSPPELYERNLPLLARVADRPEFRPHVPGFHLEGPFISAEPGYLGAHDARAVRRPDPALLEQMQSWAGGRVRLLTMAAESPGAEELARAACELGMAVSIGHSAWDEASLERMAASGARAVTHLGNGLPGILPRHPNPIWAALACDALSAMVIADGHHLPTSVLKTVLRAKGVSRTIVVSDVCPLAGQPPGHYVWAGERVVLEASGRVSNPARGCLAGSGVPMGEAMRRLQAMRLGLGGPELASVGRDNALALIGKGAEG